MRCRQEQVEEFVTVAKAVPTLAQKVRYSVSVCVRALEKILTLGDSGKWKSVSPRSLVSASLSVAPRCRCVRRFFSCVGLSSFFSRLRSERTNQIFRTELNSRLLSNTNLEAYYSPK